MKIGAVLAGILLPAVFAGGALAATAMYKADLSGTQEVPANDSKGTGSAQLTYDPATKMLTWKIAYSGLSGPATAAHIHGPALPGGDAAVVIKFGNAASPIEGSATLTDAQAADLQGGKWYVNVHTAMHKSGEIRGQVTPAK